MERIGGTNYRIQMHVHDAEAAIFNTYPAFFFVEGKKAQVCGHINIVVMGQGPSSDRGNGIDLHQQG